MANHPHHDDDQAKKKPGSGATPKQPPIPNMSLDDDDDAFIVEEAVEAEVIPLDEAAPEDAIPMIDAAPESDIVAAEPFEDDAAAVLADDELVEEIAEAEPASDVLLSDENLAAAHAETPEPRAHQAHPASDVKPLAGAPASDVNLAELFGDAYAPPASGVAAASGVHAQADEEIADVVEEIEEAEPALDAEDDVVEEIAEAEPASAVLAAEEDVAEAEPISAVMEAEEFEDVAEASDVLTGEEAAASETPSEMNSGELAEEVVEEAEPASAILVDDDDPFGVTEFADAPPLKSHDSAVLGSEPAYSGSSAVLFDEVVEEVGKKKKSVKAELDKTVAFGAEPSSAKQKAEPDSLITEEEVIGEAEPVSAVTFGEGSGRKSSATGIDEVAEALESGVGLDSNELANTSLPEPSVEFDEILDDEEVAPKSKKKKAKAVVDDDEAEAAEALDDEAAEIFDMDDEPSSAKKRKAKIKATGDDIDLDNLFSEAEAAEALDADADEAEATEAVDEDADDGFATAAMDDLDEDAPKKKKAKAVGADEDDEDIAAAVADEDEDDDAGAKPKGKEKATVAAQAQGSGGGAMRWAGRFFLLCVGMFLVCGGVLSGLMFAGGSVTPLLFTFADEAARKEAAESIYKAKAPPAPPKVDGRTQLDKLREALAKGEYDEVAKETAEATDDAELDLRGQAKWLAYLKQAGNKFDKAAPQIKSAKDDLVKAKNVPLLAQIDGLLNAGDSAVAYAKLKTLEAATRADKAKTDKVLDSIAEVLVKGDYLKDKAMLSAPALAKIMQALSDDKTTLDGVNKILTDAKYKDGEEGLKTLLKEKKGVEDSVAAVNKVLDNEKTKDKGDKGVLELVDARNKAAADLMSVAKDRDDILATMKKAYQELLVGKGGADDKADPRKELVKAAQQARVKSESPLATPLAQLGMSLGNIATGASKTVEQTFALSKVFAELGFFRTREEFIQTPQQKMDIYIALLQDRKENNAKALAAIITEAAWVLTPDSKSTPEQQAKARYVQGLALRNQEKFADAKTAFADTLTKLPADDSSAWARLARQSQKELIDANVYFLPRTERLQNEGNLKAAEHEINVGLLAMPSDARLHAQRALIHCEMVRGQGAKIPDLLQKSIRDDAEIAGRNDALKAESLYLVGRLEQELGNINQAEKLFRAAVKTHDDIKSSIDDDGKYRVALGRLLLGERTPVIAPAPADDKKGDEKKADDKVGASTPSERVLVLHPWTPLIVSALIGQEGADDIEDKEAAARLNETVKLANELIASANPKIKGQGYLLLGSAYSRQGRRTDGLKEYSKGLQLLYPGIQTAEMTKLIEEHPAFQQPDTTNTPNPVMAERHFGEGMHFYWSHDYAEAEKQFRQAVKFYDKDARYQYYLGLAQIGQKTPAKRDSGFYAFEQGARLEARTVATNPLAVRDINASLERIQGPLRQLLNSYRYKASEAPEVEKKKGL